MHFYSHLSKLPSLVYVQELSFGRKRIENGWESVPKDV
jgi:hypothetical protein